MEESAASNLEKSFHQEMIRIYERAKAECSYNATRFLQMVIDQGGLKAAKNAFVAYKPEAQN